MIGSGYPHHIRFIKSDAEGQGREGLFVANGGIGY
jgi:hypothetical protein